MTDFSKLSKEELNKMDKNVLITIIGVLQAQLGTISSQLNFLTEQIALMNQRSFVIVITGAKTKSMIAPKLLFPTTIRNTFSTYSSIMP